SKRPIPVPPLPPGEGVRGRGLPARPGYALVAVLVVIVVLSLAAYQYVEVMGAERRAAARLGTAAQARAAAVSGVHQAAAMLADPTTLANDLGHDPLKDGAFPEMTVAAGANPRQESRSSLVAVAPDGSGGFQRRYGAVVDEGGKLNINALIEQDPAGQVLYDALMKLPNMTADVADAIVDWVDADDDPRTDGAESGHYTGLARPYRAKNGPLNSLDELLFVRGVTPQLLFGTDRNRNGTADEDGGGDFGRGWADYLTVYGRELNLDTGGTLRVNANESEDLPALHGKLVTAVGQDLADLILAYKMFTVSTPPVQNFSVTVRMTEAAAAGQATTVRMSGTVQVESAERVQLTAQTSDSGGGGAGGSGSGSGSGQGQSQNTTVGTMADLSDAVKTALAGEPKNRRRLKSLLDLQNVRITLPRAENAPPDAPSVVVDSPLNNSAGLNDALPKLLDKVTTTTAVELVPRLNVNTAPREVLLTVPNLTEAVVDDIIAKREQQPKGDAATLTAAWLVTSGAMSAADFKTVEKYLTGRSMVYRVQAIGYFGEGGPTARVEAVVDTNQGAPRILYFRDLADLDTPRGFEPPR
ncbi:MAG: general secretion pathway protein GspK, partial [Gemmataceae bacterium]|nr:general secretion pathway protein GspK [Gemmataceae bacterium]